MGINFKRLSSVVALMFVASNLTGCGDSKPKAAKDSAVKIGVSFPTQQEERWVRDKATMEETAKKLGIDLKVQVADNDAAKQDAQCDNLISQGIQVLIVAPQDGKSAAAIVEKAHSANIKVIAYDRLIEGDVDYYISFDGEKVGEVQGKYISNLVPKGNYVILAGSQTDNNALLFRNGAMKHLQPLIDKGDIKVVTDQWVKDWQPNEAMKIMENALTANKNKIDAVLAPNDGTAGGCIQALASQGLAGKVPITGQDAEIAAAQRIVAGTQTMTVYKDTRVCASKAVELALKIAKGESVETQSVIKNSTKDIPAILVEVVAVDKSNIDEQLIASGYLKKEDIYK